VAANFVTITDLRAEPKLDWDPDHTWVFAVGILEWEHPEIYASFPAAMKNRRDAQLVKYFQDAGVPKKHIVYLQDADATKERIQHDFNKLLDRTGEGDLLVFYFAGHGTRDTDSGETWFANYDAGNSNSSAWNVRSIFKSIDNHFSGNRVFLLADCCHSGALYEECRRRNRDDGDAELAYAALTSSYSHNTSTGTWTYSDSLLAGLRGEGQVDLNHDGVIELNEVAEYTDLELAFLEGQKSMFFAAPAFPRAAKLAEVEGESTPRIGQRVEVEADGRWFRAKIIDVDDNQVQVHFAGYDDSTDEWVGPARLRPYQPAQFAAGDKVEVQWSEDQKWYAATILKAWYGLHLVRYDEYDSSVDEWVGPGAIRLRSK
jgi:caspase domain-containing protein/histone methyltransferase-like protein/agenet domain-containing protein